MNVEVQLCADLRLECLPKRVNIKLTWYCTPRLRAGASGLKSRGGLRCSLLYICFWFDSRFLPSLNKTFHLQTVHWACHWQQLWSGGCPWSHDSSAPNLNGLAAPSVVQNLPQVEALAPLYQHLKAHHTSLTLVLQHVEELCHRGSLLHNHVEEQVVCQTES